MRGLATLIMMAAALGASGDPLEPPRRREPEPEPDDSDEFFGHGWYPDSKPRRKPQPDAGAVARLSAAQAKRDRKAKKRLGGL